jgi:hypothetical protein
VSPKPVAVSCDTLMSLQWGRRHVHSEYLQQRAPEDGHAFEKLTCVTLPVHNPFVRPHNPLPVILGNKTARRQPAGMPASAAQRSTAQRSSAQHSRSVVRAFMQECLKRTAQQPYLMDEDGGVQRTRPVDHRRVEVRVRWDDVLHSATPLQLLRTRASYF